MVPLFNLNAQLAHYQQARTRRRGGCEQGERFDQEHQKPGIASIWGPLGGLPLVPACFGGGIARLVPLDPVRGA